MRKTLRPLARHPRTVISTAVCAVAAAIIAAAVLWPQPHPETAPVYIPPTRARVYAALTVCLLTGPGGITDAHAAPAWAGMQAAYGATHAQATYLAMQGPQTASNAVVYINTLGLQGCSLILTAGAVPSEGAAERAAAFPRTHFISLDGAKATAPNITAITATASSAIAHQVTTLITADATASSAAP